MNTVSREAAQETENRSFYNELYSRNWPIIGKNIQAEISKVRIAVAGCGSTGGAFIDGALRLGITDFKLADNGSYELNNFNRQMMGVDALNANKAASYQKRILAVNKGSKTTIFNEGITPNNIGVFLKNSDLVFDAVDVTTKEGMTAKLLLHEICAAQKIPVASALDLGFTQWLQSYNYHQGTKALNGNLASARTVSHPIKALIEAFCPIEDLPLEISDEVVRLMTNQGNSACQLGCTCFLLSAMVTPYILYFLEQKRLPPLVKFDLYSLFHDANMKEKRYQLTQESHKKLKQILEETK